MEKMLTFHPIASPAMTSSRTNHFTTPPNLVGAELSATDLGSLESRWIPRLLGEAAFLRRVHSFTGAQLVGRHGGDYSGVPIMYFAPGDQQVREYRLRRDHPDLEADSTGRLKVKQKYLSPPGRSNMLYLPPGDNRALLSHVELPLIITEGEFKTLALWRRPHWMLTSVFRVCSIGAERLAKPLRPMAKG